MRVRLRAELMASYWGMAIATADAAGVDAWIVDEIECATVDSAAVDAKQRRARVWKAVS
jgi:hypothetical protein